jgi:hypothetical protein
MNRLFSRFSACVIVIFSSALAGACAVDPDDVRREIHPVGPPMNGLHVVGNTIQNAAGTTVTLRGINRSSSEYLCVQSGGIFDGPSDVLGAGGAPNGGYANTVYSHFLQRASQP